MQVAVNLADITRIPQLIRNILLRDKVDLSYPIQTDKNKFDETAILFTCDPLTAACVCDTMRNKDKTEGRYPTRCYVRTNKAWKKIAGSDKLAIVVDEQIVLNPKVFGKEVTA